MEQTQQNYTQRCAVQALKQYESLIKIGYIGKTVPQRIAH